MTTVKRINRTFLASSKSIFMAVTLGGILASCAMSPSGRPQLDLVSDEKINELGAASFQKMKDQGSISRNPKVNEYVNCVADAMLVQLGDFGKEWEIVVFNARSANAFAVPGRKIGVHTGILALTENQDQLAAVIGHEIAHVVSKHANERMSAKYATSIPLNIAGFIYGNTYAGNQAIALLGMGSQVGLLLPFSRKHESEADELGMDMMAWAGFNPLETVKLWKNMAQEAKDAEARSGGKAKKPPEFLSTHPAEDTRVKGLVSRMGGALKLYNQAQKEGRNPKCG